MTKLLWKPLLLLAGITLGALAMLWAWKPWRQPNPAGRVILAEPVERYDPDYVYTLPTPAAPDWRRTGEVVDCPVIEPATREAKNQHSLFDPSPRDRLLWIGKLGELDYGGTGRVVLRESEPGSDELPLVDFDLRDAGPPLARWDSLHRFEVSGGVATLLQGDYGPSVDRLVGIGYRPGSGHVRRRWSLAPDFEARYRLDSGTLEASAWLTVAYCGGSDCR